MVLFLLFHSETNQLLSYCFNIHTGEVVYTKKLSKEKNYGVPIQIRNYLLVDNGEGYCLMDMLNGNINELPNEVSSILNKRGIRIFAREEERLYYVDFELNELCSFNFTEIISGRVDSKLNSVPFKKNSLNFVFFHDSKFIMWKEVGQGDIESIEVFDLETRKSSKTQFLTKYKKHEFTFFEYDFDHPYYNISTNRVPYIGVEQDKTIKLFCINTIESTVSEIELPVELEAFHIAIVNTLFSDGIYYFDLITTENSDGKRHDFLLTYDVENGQLKSLIEFYNKSFESHKRWQIGNHILYGLYKHEGSVFYYDFDVKNATMLRTNIPEEDYKIIKL